MTIQDVIKLLESDGWRQLESDDGIHRFKHEAKAGIVTLSGKLELVVPQVVLRNLLQHAQIQEGD